MNTVDKSNSYLLKSSSAAFEPIAVVSHHLLSAVSIPNPIREMIPASGPPSLDQKQMTQIFQIATKEISPEASERLLELEKTVYLIKSQKFGFPDVKITIPELISHLKQNLAWFKIRYCLTGSSLEYVLTGKKRKHTDLDLCFFVDGGPPGFKIDLRVSLLGLFNGRLDAYLSAQALLSDQSIAFGSMISLDEMIDIKVIDTGNLTGLPFNITSHTGDIGFIDLDHYRPFIFPDSAAASTFKRIPLLFCVWGHRYATNLEISIYLNAIESGECSFIQEPLPSRKCLWRLLNASLRFRVKDISNIFLLSLRQYTKHRLDGIEKHWELSKDYSKYSHQHYKDFPIGFSGFFLNCIGLFSSLDRTKFSLEENEEMTLQCQEMAEGILSLQAVNPKYPFTTLAKLIKATPESIADYFDLLMINFKWQAMVGSESIRFDPKCPGKMELSKDEELAICWFDHEKFLNLKLPMQWRATWEPIDLTSFFKDIQIEFVDIPSNKEELLAMMQELEESPKTLSLIKLRIAIKKGLALTIVPNDFYALAKRIDQESDYIQRLYFELLSHYPVPTIGTKIANQLQTHCVAVIHKALSSKKFEHGHLLIKKLFDYNIVSEEKLILLSGPLEHIYRHSLIRDFDFFSSFIKKIPDEISRIQCFENYIKNIQGSCSLGLLFCDILACEGHKQKRINYSGISQLLLTSVLNGEDYDQNPYLLVERLAGLNDHENDLLLIKICEKWVMLATKDSQNLIIKVVESCLTNPHMTKTTIAQLNQLILSFQDQLLLNEKLLETIIQGNKLQLLDGIPLATIPLTLPIVKACIHSIKSGIHPISLEIIFRYFHELPCKSSNAKTTSLLFSFIENICVSKMTDARVMENLIILISRYLIEENIEPKIVIEIINKIIHKLTEIHIPTDFIDGFNLFIMKLFHKWLDLRPSTNSYIERLDHLLKTQKILDPHVLPELFSLSFIQDFLNKNKIFSNVKIHAVYEIIELAKPISIDEIFKNSMNGPKVAYEIIQKISYMLKVAVETSGKIMISKQSALVIFDCVEEILWKTKKTHRDSPLNIDITFRGKQGNLQSIQLDSLSGTQGALLEYFIDHKRAMDVDSLSAKSQSSPKGKLIDFWEIYTEIFKSLSHDSFVEFSDHEIAFRFLDFSEKWFRMDMPPQEIREIIPLVKIQEESALICGNALKMISKQDENGLFNFKYHIKLFQKLCAINGLRASCEPISVVTLHLSREFEGCKISNYHFLLQEIVVPDIVEMLSQLSQTYWQEKIALKPMIPKSKQLSFRVMIVYLLNSHHYALQKIGIQYVNKIFLLDPSLPNLDKELVVFIKRCRNLILPLSYVKSNTIESYYNQVFLPFLSSKSMTREQAFKELEEEMLIFFLYLNASRDFVSCDSKLEIQTRDLMMGYPETTQKNLSHIIKEMIVSLIVSLQKNQLSEEISSKEALELYLSTTVESIEACVYEIVSANKGALLKEMIRSPVDIAKFLKIFGVIEMHFQLVPSLDLTRSRKMITSLFL